MALIIKISIILFIYILTIGSGVWLSKVGKPYSAGLFNLHKLLALAFVIFTIIVVKKLLKESRPEMLIWLLIFIAIISVILLFASGTLLHLDKLSEKVMLVIHKVFPFVLAVSIGGGLYLLMK